MGSYTFIQLAKQVVLQYVLDHNEPPDAQLLSPDDIYVVWYCKELQNHKALLGTPLSDGMYYECTYNGNKDEMYLDAYRKQSNSVYKRRDWWYD